ncbi:Imm44 family immunity protein [Niallia circulans]
MEIFLSGETDMEVAEQFREIRNEFEAKLESLKDKNYGSELQSIGITPIVVNLSPEYEESGFLKKENYLRKRKRCRLQASNKLREIC